jgi:hypothetical protein
MSIRRLPASTARPTALSPYLYGHYSPPKQRWWPLFACLGAGGVLALALLPQQPDGVRSTEKPVVYTVTGSNALVTMRPALEEHAGAVADRPADVPTLARPETAIDTAEAASPRGKVYSGHSPKRRASARRYAAKKSHRQEVLRFGHYGGPPWGRYGFNNNRNTWLFN